MSASASAADPAAALSARAAAWRRETVVVDYANRGLSIPEIAARLGVAEDAARKTLRRTLARMLPATPEDFAALQMSRLNEALLVAFSAMGEMGLKAVDRVLKIVRALDRLEAAARPLALALTGRAEAESAPLASAPANVPAAPRERNPNAAQTVEKSQNRSQNRGPATPANSLPPAGADPAAAARAGREDREHPREAPDGPRGDPGSRAPTAPQGWQSPPYPPEIPHIAPRLAEPAALLAGGAGGSPLARNTLPAGFRAELRSGVSRCALAAAQA